MNRTGQASKRATPGWDALTPAELKVIELTCEGLSNPEIGGRLSLSPRTIQAHLYNVFRKLGVTSRTQLVATAVRRGL